MKINITFFLLFILCLLAATSCKTTLPSTGKTITELESYNLEIDKTHPYLQTIYYRDIISFGAENSAGNMITYDKETERYYVPGKTDKTINSGSDIIEFVKVSAANFAGFTCIAPETILYSDINGNVFRIEKKSNKWEEKPLFTVKSGQKPFTAMAADQKNIYLYSKTDNGIYRFDYSGRPEVFIKTNNINVIGIDIKSTYLYILDNSGLIILANYMQNKIETEYMASNKNNLNTAFLVKQTKTETEILLNRKAEKDSAVLLKN